MKLGIFNKVFARPSLEESLDAVRRHGLESVQFGWESVGLEQMPAALNRSQCDRVRQALTERGIAMAALSGTFNMAHPDPAHRQDGLARLRVLAESCAGLGTGVITLCTGTRDPGYMWRRHPDNGTAAAWRDMADCVRQALAIAAEHRVVLAFEPEVSNVVDSAAKARRLLDELGSPWLKVVMDGANVFPAGALARMREILEEAFALLGPDIALAHGKDLVRDGEAGDRAAGTGVLDYGLYLSLLDRAGYAGSIVLHGLKEEEVPAAVAFVRSRMPGG